MGFSGLDVSKYHRWRGFCKKGFLSEPLRKVQGTQHSITIAPRFKVGSSKHAEQQKEAVTSLSLHFWCSLLKFIVIISIQKFLKIM